MDWLIDARTDCGNDFWFIKEAEVSDGTTTHIWSWYTTINNRFWGLLCCSAGMPVSSVLVQCWTKLTQENAILLCYWSEMLAKKIIITECKKTMIKLGLTIPLALYSSSSSTCVNVLRRGKSIFIRSKLLYLYFEACAEHCTDFFAEHDPRM